MKEEKFEETLSASKEEGSIAVLGEQNETAEGNGSPATEQETESAPFAEDKELAALLKTAEEVMDMPPPRDPKEIDEKAEQCDRLEERLKELPDINQGRLKRLEKIEKKWREEMAVRRKKAELPGEEYERFAESEKGKALLANLQKVEVVVAKMEREKRDDDGFVRTREALRAKQDALIESVTNTVFVSAEEAFEERIAKAGARAHELYARRASEIAARVEELEKDPEVTKRRLERLTETEAIKEAKRKETVEKTARERVVVDIELLNETFVIAASLINRQKDAIARIKEIAGEAAGTDKIRAALTDAILLGEGKRQIKSPDEIAPWKKHFSAAPYLASLYAVRERGSISVSGVGTASYFDNLIFTDDADKKRGITSEVSQKARTTVEMINQADANDRKLRDILGREWETVHFRDKKTREMKESRQQTQFWIAFETRKRNDERGETEKLRQARVAEEKRRKEEIVKMATRAKALEAEVQRLKDQAGEYAAVFLTPRGAVLLEAKKSKKGNAYIEVVDAIGEAEAKVKKGAAFLHYSNMPEWLKDAVVSSSQRDALDSALEILRRQR